MFRAEQRAGPERPGPQGRERTSVSEREEASTPLPVPDELLGPLLEVAADTLRSLDAVDVPSSLRPVHGFDRRGLLAGPARRQLLRAFVSDEAFRTLVSDRFREREEVVVMTESWSPGDAAAQIVAADARRDLSLLASILYVVQPPGADFGLGLIVARNDAACHTRDDVDATKEDDRARATLEETLRRSETARLRAETELEKLARELQKERGERRAREEDVREELRAARAEIEQLDKRVRQARTEVEHEQLRTEREIKRARALEDDARRLRAELDSMRDRLSMSRAPLDARELADAATDAEHVAARLRALERRAQTSAPTAAPGVPSKPAARPPAPATRVVPQLPAGLVAGSAAGLEAMLRARDVVLVVDGYNVTKRAWPDASAADQRERLGIAITALHRRLGCRVVVVFDGDGSGAFRPPLRRGGVRVVFSDASEEADEIVVRETAAFPKRVPVVVASSDAWIREHAEAEGAVVVNADALLKLLRPDR